MYRFVNAATGLQPNQNAAFQAGNYLLISVPKCLYSFDKQLDLKKWSELFTLCLTSMHTRTPIVYMCFFSLVLVVMY